MGKKDSKERSEIESFIEMTLKVSEDELVSHVNKHMETRMFLVGQSITCADIVVHLRIAKYFQSFEDTQKKEMPHAFRWIDHIQHLPSLHELC